MVCQIANDTRYFVQIAFQLTELFQIETDAVIYTDQLTCYIGTLTRRGWSGVYLLHDNASSHKCEVVKSFLASEKVKFLKPSTLFSWKRYLSVSPTDTKIRLFICFSRLGKKVTKYRKISKSLLLLAVYNENPRK